MKILIKVHKHNRTIFILLFSRLTYVLGDLVSIDLDCKASFTKLFYKRLN